MIALDEGGKRLVQRPRGAEEIRYWKTKMVAASGTLRVFPFFLN